MIGGFGGGEVNTGMMFVTLKDAGDRPRDPQTGKRLTQQQFMDVVRRGWNAIPGIRAVLQDPSQEGFSASRGGGFPVELTVRGRDWDGLAGYSSQIMEAMRASGQMTDVDSDYQVGMPEVQIVPDRNKAADLGVSMAAIGETIGAAIGGIRSGKFKDKGRRYDIRVRLLAQQRERPEDIGSCSCARPAGSSSAWPTSSPSCSSRPCRPSRARTGSARSRSSRTWLPACRRRTRSPAPRSCRAGILPEGYRAVPSGSTQAFQESFDSLGFAFVLGIIVAYMVLAAQFNAFTHPFTVLLALPFSVSGALLVLWLGGQSMNVYSMLGMILLMGIAKKNSIMLVDFTNQLREKGHERHEALLQACPIRLRPILMTSIATIAGALPAALALGPGAETAALDGAHPGGRHGRLHAVHAVRGARGLQRHRRRRVLERASGASAASASTTGSPPRGHGGAQPVTRASRRAETGPLAAAPGTAAITACTAARSSSRAAADIRRCRTRRSMTVISSARPRRPRRRAVRGAPAR